MIRTEIEGHIEAALAALGLSAEVKLEHPIDVAHGDYATGVALALAKEAGKDPRELAAAIVAVFPAAEWLDHAEVAGPGFINLYLSRTFFRDAVREALAAGPFLTPKDTRPETPSPQPSPVRRERGHDALEGWGASEGLRGQKVMVEHTQPNPFKPFHIGHLMSNTIGESISRLYEASGAEVRRANYQGDVGLHVAKALWGLRKLGGNPRSVEDLGNAYVAGHRAYEDDPDAKREITEFNAMVYENSAEIAEEYRIGREVSLKHFEELYRMLGTKFDHYFFESQTFTPGRALVKEGLADGVFVESEGAVVFKGEDHGLHTRVFLNKNGITTYEAKELGLAELKAEKWDFDRSITTTAVEQEEYFKVVWKALSLLRPELAAKMVHVPHGMMTLTSGKMSSRKGNVVTGESLIEDMLALAREKVADRDLTDDEKKDIAEAVAIAAIKYTVLKQKAGKNITFDPARSLSFEGDSGPYLEYAHTRAVSVLEKAAREHVSPATELAPREVTPVERLLYRFPEVVLRAREEHEPHYVTTYLVELAAAWNAWYAAEKILDGSPLAPYKLALAAAVECTLGNGLWLLGMRAPAKM